MTGTRKTLLIAVAFMALLVGLFTARMLNPNTPGEDELRELGVIILPTPRQLQPFELTDFNDRVFDQSELTGPWTFMFFGYTFCPDACPTTMATLARVDEILRDSDQTAPRVIMVSVDPSRDVNDKLKSYVTWFNPDFIGATASVPDLVELARQMSVTFAPVPANEEAGGYLVDHSPSIVIINPRGHLHGFFRTPHTAEAIARVYRYLSQTMPPA